MAFSEVYVDPSIAADSGAGTVGDPYGDLEYAIEQTTFDTTNGTRVNIKAGTAEVLAAALNTALADTSVSVAWVPSTTAPLIFQGYTATAGDGGVGEISGGDTVGIVTGATYSNVHFIDMKLGNVGANAVLDLDNQCAVLRCEIHSGSAGGIFMDNYGMIGQCYFHSITGGARLILMATNTTAQNNYMDCGGISGLNGITMSTSCVADSNIIMNLHSGSYGISAPVAGTVRFNSIHNPNAGTAFGIQATAVSCIVENNIISGFSGVGGVGISQLDTDSVCHTIKGNAVYDCTTPYDFTGTGADLPVYAEDNETLTADPFTDAANGDFSPVDTGNVKEGALPQMVGL